MKARRAALDRGPRRHVRRPPRRARRVLLDQITFLDRPDRRSSRPGSSRPGRAIPAAWGIDADGDTGPDAGTGPDAAVLPAADRLAEIPGISAGPGPRDHRRVG